MDKFTKYTGKTVALDQPNIDTDQILPKQFLKRIERTGYGEFLFYDWRFDADGTPKNDFILNDPKHKDASILIAGANFGCGSSREHAPWALEDFGFKTIIAPSFADIFYNNCFKTGILPIILPEEKIAQLSEKSRNQDSFELTVDLESQLLSDGENLNINFKIDEFRRFCLLEGLDEIGLTLSDEKKIVQYEKNRREFLLTS